MRQFPETLTAQKPGQVASQRMQLEAWQVHIGRLGRHIETRQDAFDLAGALRRNKPPIPFLVEAPEPLVAEPDDHPRIVTRYVSGSKPLLIRSDSARCPAVVQVDAP